MNLRSVETSTEELRFRANNYYLFSLLLSAPPNSEILQQVAQLGVPESQAINPFLIKLNALARAAKEHPDIEVLDDEYHDLFIGVGRGELVPYGSWYITGMLMDKPLSLLRQDLKALGIERIESSKEPEDHIAALMDIMGIVIESGEEFQFKTQQTLFSRHVKPWARRFFKDLTQARKANFYSKVGEFGIEFINFETEYLEMPV